MAEFSYCAEMARNHDRDRFLASLFVPVAPREGLLALYALNIELAQIGAKVAEPMIGAIRHAWWREGIEALYEGKTAREQPVLKALAPIISSVPKEPLYKLLETYREHFPDSPNVDAIMDEISLSYIRSTCPKSETGWKKSGNIIARHRKHFGEGRNGWLSFKLLMP